MPSTSVQVDPRVVKPSRVEIEAVVREVLRDMKPTTSPESSSRRDRRRAAKVAR